MEKNFKRLSLNFILLSLLTACSVGPDYVSPVIETPSGWKNSDNKQCNNFVENEYGELEYLDFWWQVFDDDRLNALEQMAIENNRNLYVAYERVMEARALMYMAAAELYPQITLNPQYTNTAELIKLFGISQIQNTGTTAASTVNPYIREHQLLYFLPVNLSYEVDLWGRIRDIYNSARYNYAAIEKDYEFVMLNLTADLATAYFQLRAADKELEILYKTLETRQKAFEINQARFDAKITFYADVTLAGEDVTTVYSQIQEVKRQRALLEDQIAVLGGVVASEFSLEPMPLAGEPPCIPEGIPSEVLTRRPDIQEAELQVRSDHALVKEAYAEYFPSLTLTAAGGFESPVFKLFLRNVSRYWMYGAASNQILYDGGRLNANLERSIAVFREASGNYQQQVLTAFQEVEDALANLDYYQKQFYATGITVDWAQRSYELYLDRYNFGLTYYIDVVNTERDLLNYQISYSLLLGYRYVSTIQFIRALGGGWSLPQSEEEYISDRATE